VPAAVLPSRGNARPLPSRPPACWLGTLLAPEPPPFEAPDPPPVARAPPDPPWSPPLRETP